MSEDIKGEDLHGMGWIPTSRGIKYDVFNPHVGMVDLADIAKGLSHTVRYRGQVRFFWSVAQHSMHVRHIVRRWGGSYMQQLQALCHDAVEYVVGDTPSPQKRHPSMEFWRDIEEKNQVVICEALGVRYPFDQIIHDADRTAFLLEYPEILTDAGAELIAKKCKELKIRFPKRQIPKNFPIRRDMNKAVEVNWQRQVVKLQERVEAGQADWMSAMDRKRRV